MRVFRNKRKELVPHLSHPKDSGAICLDHAKPETPANVLTCSVQSPCCNACVSITPVTLTHFPDWSLWKWKLRWKLRSKNWCRGGGSIPAKHGERGQAWARKKTDGYAFAKNAQTALQRVWKQISQHTNMYSKAISTSLSVISIIFTIFFSISLSTYLSVLEIGFFRKDLSSVR